MPWPWLPTAISLMAAACTVPSDTDSRAAVAVEGPVLQYDGEITASLNRQTRELYEASSPRPTVLRIRSVGGEIHGGMALGEFVFERGLDVEVLDYCISSCANYVITAARHVRLAPDAALIWHGGATQALDLEHVTVRDSEGRELMGAERAARLDSESLLRSRRESIERETVFFQKVGVDQRITVLGQEPLYAERYTSEAGYIGWDYSLDGLRDLGVRSVEVIGGGPWTPRRPQGARVFRVDLAATAPPAERGPALRTLGE